MTGGPAYEGVEDYEGEYNDPGDDELLQIRRGNLRGLMDVITGSMDYGSGFLNNDQVEILRQAAIALGVDPMNVTPEAFQCDYIGSHNYVASDWEHTTYKRCTRCGKEAHRKYDKLPNPLPLDAPECHNPYVLDRKWNLWARTATVHGSGWVQSYGSQSKKPISWKNMIKYHGPVQPCNEKKEPL